MLFRRVVPSYDQRFAVILTRDGVGQKTRFAEGPQTLMQRDGCGFVFDLNKNLVAATQRFFSDAPHRSMSREAAILWQDIEIDLCHRTPARSRKY